MDETRTPHATPEQLVNLLDAQLLLARAKRSAQSASPRRLALIVGGLLLIIGGCCAALLVLQQMLSDLQNRTPAQQRSVEQPAGETRNI